MKIRSILTLAVFMNVLSLHAAPRYIPVASGLFSTGQWYFEGDESSLGGNAGVTFVPAVEFSPTFSLIPTIETAYQGTRSAEELAGGNTLFQDTWSNAVNVKAVHTLSERWTVRERIGYRSKWFREFTNESFSKGLYDYRFPTIGAEVEHGFGKRTRLALGYDFSYLQFPNYESLESAQSADNAREFSGTNVLDARVHLMTVRFGAPLFWKMRSNLQLNYSPRDYVDQHVVVLSGQLSATRREDTLTAASLGLDRTFHLSPSMKLIGNMQFSRVDMDSNQNHYDARLTTFIGDFYDYEQNGIGTQVTLAFGQKSAGPMMIDFGYMYSQRDYSDRVIQAVDGSYKTEKLYQIDQNMNLGFSYPLTRSLRVRTTATFGHATSNNDYEAVYRYNYDNANYQFGFTYDY
jgi:hypothetical protein